MIENKNIITKQGLAELKLEMKNLVENDRPKVIEEIKEARAQGDLSENAEFDAAREKQGQIEDRIREIEIIIENSQVLAASKKNDKVRIGSKVTIEYLSDKVGDKEVFTIVGTLEVDPFKKLISNISPLGKAIMNKVVGEEIIFSLDQKKQKKQKKLEVKIIKIENN